MEEQKQRIFNEPAVQTHIMLLQQIIARMSGLGANVKNWTAALFAALSVVSIAENDPFIASLQTGVVLIMCGMDAYYLSLEHTFREQYDSFLKELNSGEIRHGVLFSVSPTASKHSRFTLMLCSLRSWAIFPFYLTLLLISILLMCILPILPWSG